jgi:signal transduction histidine kinase
MRLTLVPASFRGRFLLVVFGAAVVPLVLIGVWLTRSVVRAGEDLLRAELDQSIQRIATGIESRWAYRSGELALLTNNEVAHRMLAGAPSTLATEDSQYFDQLVVSLSQTIPSFEYRDARGAVRWSSAAALIDATAPVAEEPDSRAPRPEPSLASPTLTTRLPIIKSRGGDPIGELIARVDLSSLIAVDTSLRLPNGATLQLVDRGTGRSLLPAFGPDAVLNETRFATNGVDWLAVRRALADPEVDLILAAPLGAYVEPFENAARTGMITLAVVALLALVLSALLTTRLTASIEQLAVAADAVASGDLAHRVDGRGAGEVGRLAAAFNSMTESLRRTLAELSKRQALAAAGEFAASLSHEVRNGLTAVRVDLQRAEEKTAEDAPSAPLIARALENVKRLDGTVSGSLRVARSGRSPRRRLDLGPVVAAAAQSAESTFTEHRATLTPLANSSTPAWVLGDAIALEQLLLNLLLNSAQAMGPGGRASVSVEIDGSEVRVVVTDTGGGIRPEDLEHVLDPFFSTKVDGTGLGLPIARQIAAAHGGSLKIESVPGDGTRVEVRLPLAAAPMSP